jgi:hypothetical protein
MDGLVHWLVLAFGVFNLVAAAFWIWTWHEARRSREHLSPDVRALLLTRVATYAAIAVFFVLAVLYSSHWLAWIGLSALLAKLIAESWLHRRLRRTGSMDPAG